MHWNKFWIIYVMKSDIEYIIICIVCVCAIVSAEKNSAAHESIAFSPLTSTMTWTQIIRNWIERYS